MRSPTFKEVICEALASICIGLFLGTVLAVIVAHITGCARVLPTRCQPGELRRDSDHRLNGVNDCYVCANAPPGGWDGDYYRCLDYTCNECLAPPLPGMFGEKLLRQDGGER
jgi:hypothetical protein